MSAPARLGWDVRLSCSGMNPGDLLPYTAAMTEVILGGSTTLSDLVSVAPDLTWCLRLRGEGSLPDRREKVYKDFFQRNY